MCARLALFCRAAEADLRLDGDKGRMLGICLCSLDRLADRVDIIAIFYSDRLETKCLHTLLYILTECDVRASLDGDAVGIIENNQLGKSQGTCQRECLRGNAFHHTSVAAQYIGVMVNYRIIFFVEYAFQMCLSHRHADCHTHTCAQRTGRRLNANGMTIFRMSRSLGI